MSHECNCNLSNCEGGIVYYLRDPNSEGKATFTPLLLRNYHYETKSFEENTEKFIEQYYVNDSTQVVEAYYALPVEDNVYVISVDVKVDREKDFEPMNRNTDYKKGIDSTRYVVDWTNEIGSSVMADIFKIKVGFISPSTGVRIRLYYAPKACSSNHQEEESDNQSAINPINLLSPTSLSEKEKINYQYTFQDDSNEDEDDNGVDDENTRRWYDRPWGDFGRPWGDFGRPWKVNRKPWGSM